MIGKLLEYLSPNSDCDTQHCLLRCHQRQFAVSNATNGIRPPRDYLSVKKSKKGPLKQIVPSYQTLKNNYTLLWEIFPTICGVHKCSVCDTRNSSIKGPYLTGRTIPNIIQTMRSPFQKWQMIS